MQRIVLNILWASFLAAAVALACSFALGDLTALLSPADARMRMEVYGLGFLLLWLFCALAAGLAHLLNTPLWRRGSQDGEASGAPARRTAGR